MEEGFRVGVRLREGCKSTAYTKHMNDDQRCRNEDIRTT
jgi:hypothetical protein